MFCFVLCFSRLTWVFVHHYSTACEITVPGVPTLALVVAIHDIGGMGGEAVRVETRLIALDGRTIGARLLTCPTQYSL